MTIERTLRYTLRPWSSEIGDALGGVNRVQLEIHLEAMIEWTQRCTPRSWSTEFGDAPAGHDQAWRPQSSDFGDTLGCRDWASLEMHLKAMIVRICRLWPSEFRDPLGGHDWAYLKAIIEQIGRYTWRPWLSKFGDMHLEVAIERVWRYTSSAKCILVTGSLQECLRACGV